MFTPSETSSFMVGDHVLGIGMIEFRIAVATVEKHGLLAELGLVVDPVAHVVEVEGLRIHILGFYTGGLVFVDHLLGIIFLGVIAFIRHFHAGGFELGGHLDAQILEELDALGVAEHSAAGGVQIGAPVRGGVHVFLDGGCLAVGRIHLAAQRLELLQREVAGAALDISRR